jgi:predicted nucleic acid-binding protein
VSRFLLDTNIVSDATKPVPSNRLAAWMIDQVNEDLFIASITVAEIWRGVLEMPPGRKRRELESWFHGPEGLLSLFAERTLSFDAKAAMIWSRLMAEGKISGRPRSETDMILAAVAEANDCVLVTDNEKHFAGLKYINPMRAPN